jgi:hypothetical protein
MRKTLTTCSLLLAGLLGAAGLAQAQEIDSFGVPPNPMSTATRGAGPGEHLVVTELTRGNTFNVPNRAGEASTMTGGQPNLLTQNETVDSRLVIVGRLDVDSPIGTSAPAGYPSIFEGGTPL